MLSPPPPQKKSVVIIFTSENFRGLFGIAEHPAVFRERKREKDARFGVSALRGDSKERTLFETTLPTNAITLRNNSGAAAQGSRH